VSRRSREPATAYAGAVVAPSPAVARIAARTGGTSAVRGTGLQAITAALSAARTPDEVAEVALHEGVAALGGARGLLIATGADGEAYVLRSAEIPAASAERAALGDSGPSAETLRTGAPVFLCDPEAIAARYRAVDGALGAAVAALPLQSNGRTLGVLVVGWDRPRRFPGAARAFATSLAGVCAQALDRARLLVAERLARAEAVAAHRRLAFLDRVSAHLAETLEEEPLLAGVARLAVPALGDWVGLWVETERGPERVAEAGDVALRGRAEARLRSDGEPPVGGHAPAPPWIACVPLAVGGRALGALVAAGRRPRRRPGADLALAGDVARRTGLALAHVRALREAQSAARAREEFLHVASHELRGPIGSLRLSVQLMLRDAARGKERAPEERLRAIARQADRLVRLGDTLLDVSRITAGRLELSREEADVAALVREVVARQAEDAGVEIACVADGPIACLVDAARIEQVLSNLLSNALKYGRGAPVEVAVRRDGDAARIAVHDHGIGIAIEDQARIFDRFERAVSGNHYTGLGLGLWIVRQLVEAHGGTITVESAAGAGSTFVVTLPLGRR
jgi:signal transduction histidine kinase